MSVERVGAVCGMSVIENSDLPPDVIEVRSGTALSAEFRCQTETIEQEIQRKCAAPRVTPADVEAAIASEHCFTALQGARAEVIDYVDKMGQVQVPAPLRPELGLLTFCVLVLRNGFTVTGQSACASPENFDAEIGRRVARQDAVRQIWPLLGYALRDKLAAT